MKARLTASPGPRRNRQSAGGRESASPPSCAMVGEPEVQEEGKSKEEGEVKGKEMLAVAAQHAAANQVAMEVKAEGKGKDQDEVAMVSKAEGVGRADARIPNETFGLASETPASGADTPATRSLWGRLSALLGNGSAAESYGALERGPHDERELEIKDLKFAVVWKNRTINYLLVMLLVLLGVIIHFSLINAKNSHQKSKQTTDTACTGSGQQS